MTEVWTSMAGDSRYRVSDQGQIFSTLSKKILAPCFSTKKTHYQVTVSGRNRLVHHLVLEAFVGPCPDGMEALHANDIGLDNRLENLRWGTRRENVIDSVRNGTHNQVAKTHCNQGHEFTSQNTGVGKDSRGFLYRRCKECNRLDNQRRRDRKKVTA